MCSEPLKVLDCFNSIILDSALLFTHVLLPQSNIVQALHAIFLNHNSDCLFHYHNKSTKVNKCWTHASWRVGPGIAVVCPAQVHLTS